MVVNDEEFLDFNFKALQRDVQSSQNNSNLKGMKRQKNMFKKSLNLLFGSLNQSN